MKLEAAGSATWSVDNASQKETPAEGRGSKTSLGSVTLFPPREASFLTYSLSLPNWHCDSCWWTACRLSSARFLSPVHHPVATSAGCLACGMGLLNTQRDRRLSANVVAYTAILVQCRDIDSTRLGQADHYARTTYQASSMSRRGIHPLLMGLDKPKPKLHFKKQTDLSGYESAQRKRFLRAEIEEEKLAAAAGRRHLLKLERQVA